MMATDEMTNLWREDNATVVVHRDHNKPTLVYAYDEERQVWSNGEGDEVRIEGGTSQFG